MTAQRLCGPQGQPCTRNCGIDSHWQTAETPHDIAARHFWEPNQALHIDVYTGPSRLSRALDWVGNRWDKLNDLSRVCVCIAGVAFCFAVAVASVG